MGRSVVTLIALLCLLPMLACEDWSATSTSPFYSDMDVAYEPGLVGEWRLYGDNQPWEGDEPLRLTFAEGLSTATAGTTSKPLDKQKSYKVQIQTLGTGNEIKAVLFDLDGETFLDIERSGTSDYNLLLPDTLTTHKVLRVKQQGDVLIVGYLRGDWAQAHIPKDRWDGSTMLLSTEDLKKLLSQSLKSRNAFSGEYRLSRKGSDASRHDKLDYAERLTAWEFVNQGDYESALKALRLAVNARPDNHDTYAMLGAMQMANGDADDARKSISRWGQQCREVLERGFGSGACFPFAGKSPDEERVGLDTIQHALLGISYFAERNWKESDREFRLVVNSSERATEKELLGDVVILLQSLALGQLRNNREAASILESNRDAMDNDAIKLIADYLQGKIKENDLLKAINPNGSSSEGECTTECQMYFYIASRHFAEGDSKTARKWFQKTLDVKQFAGVEPIVARLRLKQLER